MKEEEYKKAALSDYYRLQNSVYGRLFMGKTLPASYILTKFYTGHRTQSFKEKIFNSKSKHFWIMRHWLNLVPASLARSLHKSCLISRPVRKCENEDPVLLPILPASIQNISIWKCLISCSMLLGPLPSPCKDITVGKEIGSLSVSVVFPELPYIFVTSIGPSSPPKLSKPFL